MFKFGSHHTPKEIPDLFDSADLYSDELDANLMFEVVTAGTPVLTEKVRIRAYSARYYEWIGQPMPVAEKAPQIRSVAQIAADAMGKKCKSCAGTGLYRLHKFNKDIPCAKCAGKGIVTMIDEARTKAYIERRASGKVMSVSHTDYVH